MWDVQYMVSDIILIRKQYIGLQFVVILCVQLFVFIKQQVGLHQQYKPTMTATTTSKPTTRQWQTLTKNKSSNGRKRQQQSLFQGFFFYACNQLISILIIFCTSPPIYPPLINSKTTEFFTLPEIGGEFLKLFLPFS